MIKGTAAPDNGIPAINAAYANGSEQDCEQNNHRTHGHAASSARPGGKTGSGGKTRQPPTIRRRQRTPHCRRVHGPGCGNGRWSSAGKRKRNAHALDSRAKRHPGHSRRETASETAACGAAHGLPIIRRSWPTATASDRISPTHAARTGDDSNTTGRTGGHRVRSL